MRTQVEDSKCAQSKKREEDKEDVSFGSGMILKCAHVVVIPGLLRKIHKLEEENAKIRRRS
ncbi:unnamed protein product, partial [Prunus brigantina]